MGSVGVMCGKGVEIHHIKVFDLIVMLLVRVLTFISSNYSLGCVFQADKRHICKS